MSIEHHLDKSFSRRLAALLTHNELTQAALAEKVGVSQASVFKWLNGTLPRSAELYRLAKVLGKSMDWLLVGSVSLTQGNVPARDAIRDEVLSEIQRELGLTPEQFYRLPSVIHAWKLLFGEVPEAAKGARSKK